MAFLERAQLLERFRKDGTNSSHFVWLLAGLKYYETANHWVFGYQTVGEVTLLALEPLIPGAPRVYAPQHQEQFAAAWAEFSAAARVRIAAFVAVYEPFLALLKNAGFCCVKVGEEPWVDLNACIPTGNSGKGVRNARNQAINAGLRVEEWAPSEIAADAAKLSVLREIHAEWRSGHVVEFGGFMNASDPFELMGERRYFVLKSAKGRVESYLVATPVPGRQGYFLEDLIARRPAPRGAGELLTLEAMVALGESGAKEASLGVVSLTTMDSRANDGLPKAIKFLMVQVPAAMATVYNFDGLEMYRKRFKPRHWDSVHLGVKNEAKAEANGTLLWLRVVWALLVAFRPRPHLTFRWLWERVSAPFRQVPLTIAVMMATMFLFARVNHFGELPEWALARYGFFASAPLSQWPFRSVVSDLLYFDLHHFLSCALPLFGLLYWGERAHRRRLFIPLMAATFLFDDFINYLVLVKPFENFHPAMFQHQQY